MCDLCHIWSTCAGNACVEWDRCKLETKCCCSFFPRIFDIIIQMIENYVLGCGCSIRFGWSHKICMHTSYNQIDTFLVAAGGSVKETIFVTSMIDARPLGWCFDSNALFNYLFIAFALENIDHITQLKWNSNHEQITQFNRKTKTPHAAAYRLWRMWLFWSAREQKKKMK